KEKKAKLREENRKAYLDVDDEEKGEQIKINLNGRINSENQQAFSEPDYIENDLFKKEEEKKEDKTKQVLQLEHAISVEDENYQYPPIELLSKGEKKAIKGGAKALADVATKLQKTLYSFGVQAKVENVTVGPAITR